MVLNDLSVPSQDYAVLDLVGKGGFACVYRAKSKNNGLEVAIKMVRICLCIHKYKPSCSDVIAIQITTPPISLNTQFICGIWYDNNMLSKLGQPTSKLTQWTINYCVQHSSYT